MNENASDFSEIGNFRYWRKNIGRKTACTRGDLLQGIVDKSWKRKYNSQRNIFRETDGFLTASQTHTA